MVSLSEALLAFGGGIQDPQFAQKQKLLQQQQAGQQALQQAFNPPAFQQADLLQGGDIGANARAMQQRSILGALAKIDPSRACLLYTSDAADE